MLHAGLDLSRRRLDVWLLDERGELVAESAVPPDVDGLHGLRAAPAWRGMAPARCAWSRTSGGTRVARAARRGGASARRSEIVISVQPPSRGLMHPRTREDARLCARGERVVRSEHRAEMPDSYETAHENET